MKKVSESSVETRYIVMPNDSNPHGTIFGGTVMSWIDMAAAMVASRHSNTAVVTVHVGDISFLAPLKIGEHALVRASLNYVGRTSMLVGVKVIAENPITRITRHTTTAYLTFVALDDKGNPCEVTRLDPQTPDQIRRYDEGKTRMEKFKTQVKQS